MAMRRSATFHSAQLDSLFDWVSTLPAEEAERVRSALKWATSNRGAGFCTTRQGYRFNGSEVYDALVWVKERHRQTGRDTWTLDFVGSMLYSDWEWDDGLTRVEIPHG